MDDVQKLEALRVWVITEPGSKRFFAASAVRAYESQGNFLLARLNDGHVPTLAAAAALARACSTSAERARPHEPDAERSNATLAFWGNVLAMVMSLAEPPARPPRLGRSARPRVER